MKKKKFRLFFSFRSIRDILPSGCNIFDFGTTNWKNSFIQEESVSFIINLQKWFAEQLILNELVFNHSCCTIEQNMLGKIQEIHDFLNNTNSNGIIIINCTTKAKEGRKIQNFIPLMTNSTICLLHQVALKIPNIIASNVSFDDYWKLVNDEIQLFERFQR